MHESLVNKLKSEPIRLDRIVILKPSPLDEAREKFKLEEIPLSRLDDSYFDRVLTAGVFAQGQNEIGTLSEVMVTALGIEGEECPCFIVVKDSPKHKMLVSMAAS